MPRQARLDSPGTLHHVIFRGIEKNNIVEDEHDRSDLVKRLGLLAVETETHIYAWALMSNHMHILLKSGPKGLSQFMRRLLTGYAITFNLRHARHGHLFQNRYKSIVCDEDTYFQELVRYIHLNPLRAGIVKNMSSLDTYPWCGHSTIMRKKKNDWHKIDYVLSWFGEKRSIAIKNYRKYMAEGIKDGRRDDLVGGGLLRTLGGWSQVVSSRKSNGKILCDDRILGKDEFVERVIGEAENKIKAQIKTNEQKIAVHKMILEVCKEENINIKELKGGSRRGNLPVIRSRLAREIVVKYGLTLAETARQLGVTTSAISKIFIRNK